MAEQSADVADVPIKKAPVGLAALALVGPSMVWAAEYIGSGEVILATRTGAILGTGVLWAIVLGIFLKFWIGMSGARYTVCTGEGMIDMFNRIPGPRHWAVWLVLVVQLISATFAIGAVVTAAGIFVSNIVPASVVPACLAGVFPGVCGWIVTLAAVAIVWSGVFDVLKIVMSVFVLIMVLGVIYVSAHVFPGVGELLGSTAAGIPEVPQWAIASGAAKPNPWREVLPLLGWGAGGFASQVWYTYWVLGAGYGAAAGRGYGQPADLSALRRMTHAAAERIKGWCFVLYTDATLAMVIGIVVTAAFFIAGAGVLRPAEIAPEGPDVALKLSALFSSRWGAAGGFLFMLAGAAALISTQVGQLAGWPRLLADACRICIPGFAERFRWKTQFRLFLLFFLCANLVIVFCFKEKPVILVQFAALLDGLLLTPLQALCVAAGLFLVLPRLLSEDAARVLRPHPVFAVGLAVAFLVFAYFCVVQMPVVLFGG